MSTTPHEPLPANAAEPGIAADRRRRWWVVAASVVLPLAVVLASSLNHPDWGFAVLVLGLLAAGLIGYRRRQRTLEATDERARYVRLQATSFSWWLVTTILVVVVSFRMIRYGAHNADPYLGIGIALVVSYMVARLWGQWRDN